jgi:hypothetical protein
MSEQSKQSSLLLFAFFLSILFDHENWAWHGMAFEQFNVF